MSWWNLLWNDALCPLLQPQGDNKNRSRPQHRRDGFANASVERQAKLDIALRLEAAYEAMIWIIAKTQMRSMSLVLFFAFCQILGAMCAVPDLSLANDMAQLAEDMSDMACPMDNPFMCPPSAVSSPERQLKHSVAIDLNQLPALSDPVVASDPFPASAPRFWSSDSEIVPISIASSAVLRI
jgi:hypothetical protein